MLMAIPILMVVLSTTLPAGVNRVTNLVVAAAYVAISRGNALGESWAYYYALAVGLEVTVLALILRYAWTWPRTASPATAAAPWIARPCGSSRHDPGDPAARHPPDGSVGRWRCDGVSGVMEFQV